MNEIFFVRKYFPPNKALRGTNSKIVKFQYKYRIPDEKLINK